MPRFPWEMYLYLWTFSCKMEPKKELEMELVMAFGENVGPGFARFCADDTEEEMTI